MKLIQNPKEIDTIKNLSFIHWGKLVNVDIEYFQTYLSKECGIGAIVKVTDKGIVIDTQTYHSSNSIRRLLCNYMILSAQAGEGIEERLLVIRKKRDFRDQYLPEIIYKPKEKEITNEKVYRS